MARLYEGEGAGHCEGRDGQHPGLLRHVRSCRDAFDALEQWTQDGARLPTTHLVQRGDPSVDLANTCGL